MGVPILPDWRRRPCSIVPKETIGKMIIDGRSKGGARLVPTTAAGVKAALFEALHRNELVAILPDQQPRHAGKSAGYSALFQCSCINHGIGQSSGEENRRGCFLYTYVERLPKPKAIACIFFLLRTASMIRIRQSGQRTQSGC